MEGDSCLLQLVGDLPLYNSKLPGLTLLQSLLSVLSRSIHALILSLSLTFGPVPALWTCQLRSVSWTY